MTLLVIGYVVASVFGCIVSLVTTIIAYRSRVTVGIGCTSTIAGGLLCGVVAPLTFLMKGVEAFAILAVCGIVVGLLTGGLAPRFRRRKA